MATYRRIVVDTVGDLSSLRIDEQPLPELSEEEVLVQMEYSTLNPSDMGIVMGRYPSPTNPVLIGLEGSGTVTKAGSGEYAQSLLNKRVAVRGYGTWGEYVKVSSDSVFPLLDSTSFEQAANLIVNPMTVLYFAELIKTGSHKVVVQNAAASALGKMLVKWCKIEGVHLINLVRREEQVNDLKNIGAEIVFNTSEEGWKLKAKEIVSGLGGTSIGFECIGGSATNDLVDLLDYGGTAYVYGRLSGEDCRVSQGNLLMQDKTVKGLWLTLWMNRKSRAERVEIGNAVQVSLEQVFGTEHSRVVSLSQGIETLKSYKNESATNNKLLIRTKLD